MTMIVKTKKCSGRCGEIKLLDYFYKGRNKCKNCLTEQCKKYYKNNEEKIKKYREMYDKENKEKISKQVAKYQVKNKEKLLEYIKKYRKERRKDDFIFKFRNNISRSIARVLKRNNSSKNGQSILKYLPYAVEQLCRHLESLFEPWMTWENQGKYNPKTWDDNDAATWKWQLDHIIPHSTFHYENMECGEFQKCWALSNLRPLSAKQNQLDGATKSRHKSNNTQDILPSTKE